jgi:hypothetical protein
MNFNGIKNSKKGPYGFSLAPFIEKEWSLLEDNY